MENNWIKNADGEVKMLTEKGEVKWIHENAFVGTNLLKTLKLTPVQAPLHLPPLDPAKVSKLVPIPVADSSMELTTSTLTEVKEDQSEDFEIETVEAKQKKSIKPKK